MQNKLKFAISGNAVLWSMFTFLLYISFYTFPFTYFSSLKSKNKGNWVLQNIYWNKHKIDDFSE